MEITESKALATLITSLKRKLRTADPITVAACAKYLVNLYGSHEEVAKKVGVSDSTIQIWMKIADLPKEFQNYIMEKKIYPVAAYKIASAFSKPEEQLEIARAVLGWGEPEIVMLIRCKKSRPQLSIEECKHIVITKGIKQMFLR